MLVKDLAGNFRTTFSRRRPRAWPQVVRVSLRRPTHNVRLFVRAGRGTPLYRLAETHYKTLQNILVHMTN
jgi:hypothetical protein